MSSQIFNPAQQEGEGFASSNADCLTEFEKAKQASTKQLEVLQIALKHNERETNTARALGYLYLAQLYLWQVSVMQVFGLWDYYESLVQGKRSVVKDVKSGTNFASLLKLGFQQYLNVDSNFISRKNILLNRIDKEYRNYPERYQFDAEKKLQTFLLTYKPTKNQASAPVVDKTFNVAMEQALETIEKAQASSAALVAPSTSISTKTVANYVGGIHSVSTQTNTFQFTDLQRITHLTKPAMAYFLSMDAGNCFTSTYNILPNEKLSAGDSQDSRKQPAMSIALISQNEHGKFVVDASLPSAATAAVQEFITDRLVHTYRGLYSALPDATRSIFETLRTQMLTDAFVSYEDAEREKQRSNLTAANNLVKAHHRLTYRTTTGDFLFSRANTKNGVVTTAKPKSAVFAPLAADVFMGKRAFTRLYKLMASRDTHMFTVNDPSQIPLTTGQSLFYAMTELISRTNINHKVPVAFANVPSGSVINYGQVAFNSKNATAVENWSLTPQIVKSFATDAVNVWLDKYSKKVRRERHQLVQLEVDSNGIRLYFDKDDGNYVQHFAFNFPTPVAGQASFACEFKSIELMPVLSCLSAIEFTGDISLTCNKGSVVFDFETTATSFQIAVPMHMSASQEHASPIDGFETYILLETPTEPFISTWDDYNELTD